MIEAVQAINFKCLSDATMAMRALTLFTGTNSVGKTSVLQSLLLARLAASKNDSATRILPLNGPFGLRLGEFLDIIRHDSKSENVSGITIRLTEENINHELRLVADAEQARYASFEFVSHPPPSLSSSGLGSFTYLASDRLGPSNSLEMQSLPKEFLELGCQGQFVAEVLSCCERDQVSEAMGHPEAKGQRLLKHVEFWLSTFVPNVEIRTERYAEFDRVAMRFKRGGISSEWERPGNIGFGVSYCLPIILAGLIARPGSLLVVESPEAHLHPSAQSAMGSFLARAAASGIQVVVETHSDHILNGVRKAAVMLDHPLRASEVVINHLSVKDGVTRVEQIAINPKGNLTSKPRDFFDQTEIDISAIIKAKL